MLIILTPLPGVGVAHLRKAEDHQIGMDIGSCHCLDRRSRLARRAVAGDQVVHTPQTRAIMASATAACTVDGGVLGLGAERDRSVSTCSNLIV